MRDNRPRLYGIVRIRENDGIVKKIRQGSGGKEKVTIKWSFGEGGDTKKW